MAAPAGGARNSQHGDHRTAPHRIASHRLDTPIPVRGAACRLLSEGKEGPVRSMGRRTTGERKPRGARYDSYERVSYKKRETHTSSGDETENMRLEYQGRVGASCKPSRLAGRKWSTKPMIQGSGKSSVSSSDSHNTDGCLELLVGLAWENVFVPGRARAVDTRARPLHPESPGGSDIDVKVLRRVMQAKPQYLTSQRV